MFHVKKEKKKKRICQSLLSQCSKSLLWTRNVRSASTKALKVLVNQQWDGDKRKNVKNVSSDCRSYSTRWCHQKKKGQRGGETETSRDRLQWVTRTSYSSLEKHTSPGRATGHLGLTSEPPLSCASVFLSPASQTVRTEGTKGERTMTKLPQ